MNTDETLRQISNKEFLDEVYHFSYHRCASSFEAEELCAEVILAVISAVKKQDQIMDFYAFLWTIAHRVYADFCEKRKRRPAVSIEDLERTGFCPAAEKNEIDNMIDKMTEAEELKKIFEEIVFLSKAYRDTMVMYYIDGIRIRDIAQKLGISEAAVKQRLFAARNIVRKEVESMDNRKLSLKPIYLKIVGTGEPEGNDPRVKAERMLSKNLIYLCRNKPKRVKELSEALCVPMPYIEEELEIQCRGENGKYGLLRKLGEGRYISNILVAEYEEYVAANEIYRKHVPEICAALKSTVEQEKDRILSFPYLSPQKDVRFIMWALIWRIVWDIEDRVIQVIADKFFSDITPVKREFSCAAVASHEEMADLEFTLYSTEGIDAMEVAGFREVHLVNYYGKRLEPHFRCGHNISRDTGLLMTLKAIGGLAADGLTRNGKEIAAKAIAHGYLRRDGNEIVPKMVVIDKKNADGLLRLSCSLARNIQGIIEAIAEELAVFMKKHIPAHLMDEYQLYQMIAAGSFLSNIIEEGISQRLLSEPEGQSGAEGLLMIVEK